MLEGSCAYSDQLSLSKQLDAEEEFGGEMHNRAHNRAGFTLVEALVVLVVVFLAVIILVNFNWGPNNDSAQKAIEAHGFKNITSVERHWFGSHYFYGCGGDDAFAFTANAVNANNQPVKLVACTGYFFKGYTIRSAR